MNKRKRFRAKRLIAGLAIGIVVLLAVLTPIISWRLGPIVRRAAETFGPQFLGVPVLVENVDIKPWRGFAEIEGVAIGNPVGFETPQMFELGRVRIVLSLASLRSDTLHVREVLISDPRVTYELRGRRTNIGTLLAGLEKRAAEAHEPAEEVDKKAPGRKVIVEHFRFEGGRLGFSTLLTGGRSVEVPLPVVELHELGKRDGGLGVADMVYQITKTIALSVGRGAAEASGQLVGGGAELLQSAASGGAEAVLGIAGDAATGVLGETGRQATEHAGRAVGSLLRRRDRASETEE